MAATLGVMGAEATGGKKKLPVIKLALVAVVLVAGAVLVMRGFDVRGWIERGMERIRSAGPVPFYAAMLVLPAFGAPLLAFTIPSGEAFAERMGMGGVIAVGLLVLAVNLALVYWLARWALRPWLSKLVARYGYAVPRVTKENALMVTLVVRLTPGPPYFLQGYVLGLAEVPFLLYLVVSWLCVTPWAVAGIVLGRGVLNGNFRVIGLGIGLIVVALVVVHWIRKKYVRRTP